MGPYLTFLKRFLALFAWHFSACLYRTAKKQKNKTKGFLSAIITLEVQGTVNSSSDSFFFNYFCSSSRILLLLHCSSTISNFEALLRGCTRCRHCNTFTCTTNNAAQSNEKVTKSGHSQKCFKSIKVNAEYLAI